MTRAGKGFDAADRMQSVSSPAGTFTYTYQGPGTVWTNLALPNSSAITNAFDTGGRMSITALKNSGGTVLNKHAYLYNGGGQRQRNTLLDGSYTTYSFDDDGQLASSLGYTSGGAPVAGEQLTFLYDPGWNLTNRSVNGVAGTYTVDSRNQLATEPGFTDSYDVHGNLVGRYNGNNQLAYGYTFDQEQRLTSAYYQDPAMPTSYWYRTDYVYDGMSRLRVRSEFTWMVGTGWYQGPVTRYIYDGMRVVQERNSANVPSVAYTRGKDLSGSLEGAGGIGGLLARSHGYSAGNWSTHNCYHADALGNVTYLVSSAQAMVASYKYDPYGRTISSSGSLASANLYRFSSKEVSAVSGMYYYGYRFYDPKLQRWVNRDPIHDLGSRLVRRTMTRLTEANSYLFVMNEPANRIDALGLFVAPPGTADTRALESLGKCYGIYANRDREYHRLDSQGRLKRNADKWYHCVVSCEITRECGASVAKVLGSLREAVQKATGHSERSDTFWDEVANSAGRECGGCQEKRSCEQCCEEKGYER